MADQSHDKAPGSAADRAWDHQRVQSEMDSSDQAVKREQAPPLWMLKPTGPVIRPTPLLPKSSFEDVDLNTMIDLVQHGNPADMENAGKALWDARDALTEAAEELDRHVKALKWKGEAGAEFHSFGTALVAHTLALSDFANTAGTQITVAGSGLKSVHSSMPPRDSRLEKKRVDDIPLEKRIDVNPEYTAAVKVEGHRQEAINQMNRLASFYKVSGENLVSHQTPVFDRPLNVDMPEPDGDARDVSASGAARGNAESLRSSGPPSISRHTELAGGGAVGSGMARAESLGHAPPSALDTSMAIDGVTAPPAPTPLPDTTTLPTPSGPSGPAGGFAPPPPGGFGNTKGGNGPRSFASAPPERSGQAAGRAVGNPGGGRESTGRTGPVGRPSGAGGPERAGTGRTSTPGISGGTAQSPPAGRSGTTGHPMGGGQAGTGGGSGGRSGRSSGIVGGNPQRAASGSSGSRIPRGTVVGAEGATSGRPAAGRAGQSGVVGASPANRATGPGGRGTASSKGIVGTPRGSTPGARPGTRGFTQGGAGLVRGPGGRNQSEDDEQETGGSRPDYLTEDEETWTAGGRTIVPPVIE